MFLLTEFILSRVYCTQHECWVLAEVVLQLQIQCSADFWAVWFQVSACNPPVSHHQMPAALVLTEIWKCQFNFCCCFFFSSKMPLSLNVLTWPKTGLLDLKQSTLTLIFVLPKAYRWACKSLDMIVEFLYLICSLVRSLFVVPEVYKYKFWVL